MFFWQMNIHKTSCAIYGHLFSYIFLCVLIYIVMCFHIYCYVFSYILLCVFIYIVMCFHIYCYVFSYILLRVSGGTGTGGITGGSVGASTNNSSGLSTIEISECITYSIYHKQYHIINIRWYSVCARPYYTYKSEIQSPSIN